MTATTAGSGLSAARSVASAGGTERNATHQIRAGAGASRPTLAVVRYGALAVCGAAVAAVLGTDATIPRAALWIGLAALLLAAFACLRLHDRVRDHVAALASRRQEIEALVAELRATEDELHAFSYSVSHDLRAPLRAIDGFSRIVIESGESTLTSAQRRHLDLVRDNTQAMGALIDGLVAFSRLAYPPLNREPVDTAALVEAIELSSVADRPHRQIEFLKGVLPVVAADPVLLR